MLPSKWELKFVVKPGFTLINKKGCQNYVDNPLSFFWKETVPPMLFLENISY